jgi:hypothetical protein
MVSNSTEVAGLESLKCRTGWQTANLLQVTEAGGLLEQNSDHLEGNWVLCGKKDDKWERAPCLSIVPAAMDTLSLLVTSLMWAFIPFFRESQTLSCRFDHKRIAKLTKNQQHAYALKWPQIAENIQLV